MLDPNSSTSEWSRSEPSTSQNIATNVTRSADDGEVFYETAAAQGISGLFVALAIVVSVHQVS